MPNHPRDFTLIELLVVIAIVAVLAGMLISVLGVVRNQTRQAMCASNLRQLSLVVFVYNDDNEGSPPFVNNQLGAPYSGYYPLWHTQLAELLDILVTNAGNGHLVAAAPSSVRRTDFRWESFHRCATPPATVGRFRRRICR